MRYFVAIVDIEPSFHEIEVSPLGGNLSPQKAIFNTVKSIHSRLNKSRVENSSYN